MSRPALFRPRFVRRAGGLLALGALLTLTATPVSAGAATTAPPRTTVAAVPQGGAPVAMPALTNIRVGAHPGFDRVVLDFDGPVPAYGIVGSGGLTGCASGLPVPLPGEWFIEVRATNAVAHDSAGNPTRPGPQIVTTSLPSVSGYALTCDFEGHVNVGIGIRGNVLQIKSFPLTSPSRIVVDIVR